MGTRNLTLVKKNNEYKIAQYGQWDGYPAGQGSTVLRFLKNWNRETFEKNLEECKFFDFEEDKEFVEKINNTPNWQSVYPELSRDTGADILKMVQNNPLILRNRLDFAADSLFCEWAYLIDLDENVLEVYQGFNKNKLTEDDRFYFLVEKVEEGSAYQPIKMIKKYSLDNLPDENIFIEECDPSEEEEDDNY